MDEVGCINCIYWAMHGRPFGKLIHAMYGEHANHFPPKKLPTFPLFGVFLVTGQKI
jgi:hypothetical protein